MHVPGGLRKNSRSENRETSTGLGDAFHCPQDSSCTVEGGQKDGMQICKTVQPQRTENAVGCALLQETRGRVRRATVPREQHGSLDETKVEDGEWGKSTEDCDICRPRHGDIYHRGISTGQTMQSIRGTKRRTVGPPAAGRGVEDITIQGSFPAKMTFSEFENPVRVVLLRCRRSRRTSPPASGQFLDQ